MCAVKHRQRSNPKALFIGDSLMTVESKSWANCAGFLLPGGESLLIVDEEKFPVR